MAAPDFKEAREFSIYHMHWGSFAVQCSNCGKKISFRGSVCPYCQCDKSKDQFIEVLEISGGIIGGLLGYLISSPCTGPFLGLIVGALAFMILAIAVSQRK
jgi:hypothetical protein